MKNGEFFRANGFKRYKLSSDDPLIRGDKDANKSSTEQYWIESNKHHNETTIKKCRIKKKKNDKTMPQSNDEIMKEK